MRSGALWGLFLFGLVIGVASAMVVLGMQVRHVREHGVTVYLDGERLARAVQAEVTSLVQREMPGALVQLEATLPDRVGTEIARRMAATKLDIGGFKVAVPQAMITQMKVQSAEVVRYGLDLAVKTTDVEGTAKRLGEEAYHLVRTQLGQALEGQVFEVEILPVLKIPVHVRVR